MEVDPPLHIDFAVPALGVGNGLTVIFTLSDLLQPVAVITSVNLYVVVVVGDTVGFALVEINPLGLLVQLYV